MADLKNIYDRPAQPYARGDYWKIRLNNRSDNVLSPSEITQITDFINYKTISSGISDLCKTGYVCALRVYKRYCPGEISAITLSDLYTSINDINQDPNYSINTKAHIVMMVKAFYKFLIKKGYTTTINRSDMDDIKPLSIPATVKTPDDLPTPTNIHSITTDSHCTVMFSALINTIYYTGGRVSEILSLNWGDIQFDNQYVKIMIRDTKDNKIRYVPCVQALPFLAAWRRQYPTAIIGGPEKNNPVFVSMAKNGIYKRLQYMSARNIWSRLQDHANVHPKNGKKYFGFHCLRAAHITNLAAANVPDAVIRDIAWGNQNTQMMSHYLLLSDKTKENLILRSAGIETEDTAVTESAIVLCPKCNAPNGPRDRYCRFCGESLSQSAKNTQAVLDRISSDKPVDVLGALSWYLGVPKEELKAKLLKSL